MEQVYTSDQALIKRLKGLFGVLDLVDSVEKIDAKRVVITDVASALGLMNEREELRVLALSDVPSFQEGAPLLQKGLKGYANTHIHLLHLTQAIDVINSGNIWLYPSFMQELIAGSVPKADPKDEILNPLTSRERETALLVAEGKSNKEIASTLNITERTVKAHLTSIYTKTGLSDRLSLAKNIYS